MQDVGTLGVDEVTGYIVTGSRSVRTVAQGYGADVDGAKTLGIALQQHLALVFPEFEIFFGSFSIMLT